MISVTHWDEFDLSLKIYPLWLPIVDVIAFLRIVKGLKFSREENVTFLNSSLQTLGSSAIQDRIMVSKIKWSTVTLIVYNALP